MNYREPNYQCGSSSSSPGQEFREQGYRFEQQIHQVGQEGNESVRHFKNDSDSHMGLQIRASPRPPSSSRQNQFTPVSSGNMTPKQSVGQTAGREAFTAEIRDRVSKEYPVYLQQVLNEGVSLPIFTFLPGESQIHWSKFLCFPLNSKNSKNVKYDPALATCVPVFKCQFCKKSFMKPSALGGHLSKCKQGQIPLEKTPSECRSICQSSPAQKKSTSKQKNASRELRKRISKRRTVVKKQTSKSS